MIGPSNDTKAIESRDRKELIWMGVILLFLIFLIALVHYMFLNTWTVRGVSMLPTLHDDQRIIIFEFATPERGDIVVARHPRRNVNVVKRVIAVGGDTITFDGGSVYVNDVLLQEDYAMSHQYTFPTVGDLETLKEKTQGDAMALTPYYKLPDVEDIGLVGRITMEVPTGYIFVMGDNRPNSSDSRFFGPFSVDRVRGVVIW